MKDWTRRFAAGVMCLLAGCAAAAWGESPFTLEAVMSAPFPSDLVASPATGAVAWVQSHEGRRNVWVAEPPGYKGRQLTQFNLDSGLTINNLQWAPDGKQLLYQREADRTAAPTPSPLSLDTEEAPGIWLHPISGGAPRRITGGGAPRVAPDGKTVVFHRGSSVMQVSLLAQGGAKEGPKAEPIFTPTRSVGGLRFSPDGRRLAFVSERGRHSFVGVFDLASQGITWLDPGLDNDVGPTWSPDGREVAFLRLPATHNDLPFFARREDHPFSIRVADVTTGRGREVWRAETGQGSVFRELGGDENLFWAAGSQLVFPWEKNGWTQLWAVSIRGETARLLTPGELEVDQVVLTGDRTALLYSSNQDDPHRRHLWRVEVAGGAPQALTAGKGLEWSPVEVRGGASGPTVAFLRSEARAPARASILLGGEVRDLAPETVPSSFPGALLVEPQAVTVTASDGQPIPAQLFLPPNLEPGRRAPAIAYFHGGSRRQMLLGFHPMSYYHHAYSLNQWLVAQGYVVLSVNYRSGTGYGFDFREAPRYGAGGGSELADVLGAGLYLRGRADVDPARIGLWGGSYGGYLTAMGLAHASHLFKAGVDLHGVHDWNVGIKNFAPGYERLANPERAAKALAASPLGALDGWRSPVLLIHGDADRNVQFSESIDLAIALRRKGVVVEELVFPDEVHSFLRHDSWLKAFAATADFFRRHLAN